MVHLVHKKCSLHGVVEHMLTNEHVDLCGMPRVLHVLFVVVMLLGHNFCASH